MQARSGKKRVHPRFSTSGRFRANQLPLLHRHRKSQAFEGKVKDISDGGFCVTATRAPERSGLLQGRLLFPPHPAGTTESVCNTSSELTISFVSSPAVLLGQY